MAIVTGYTKAHMDSIKAGIIVGGSVVNGDLILTKFDGSTINLGQVRGAQGLAGTNGTDGQDGAAGQTGPPGTAGIWYSDETPQQITNIQEATYSTLGTIVIPTASFNRKVVLWSQVCFLGLVSQSGVYRAAIRNAVGPTTVTSLPWQCTADGQFGNISLVTSPILIGANTGATTFTHSVRRDPGSPPDPTNGGGWTDGDSAITKFIALVSPV